MKSTTIVIIVVGILVGGIFILSKGSPNTNNNASSIGNVSVINGKQLVQLNAKGGYQPRVSTATAGLPTVLRFNTNGTFDCSSSIRIPSMGVSKILPASGVTDIDLGVPKEGTLQGSCGMGMYPFEINFQN